MCWEAADEGRKSGSSVAKRNLAAKAQQGGQKCQKATAQASPGDALPLRCPPSHLKAQLLQTRTQRRQIERRSPSSFQCWQAQHYLSLCTCARKGCGRYHSLMLVQQDATCWVNSRLHSLASHVQVLGSPLSCDFKNEVLSIQQLEALAEKQPRSRKELSMLYTDQQLCLGSQRTHSSAVNSISNAEVRVIAIHSLGVACITSRYREAASEYDSACAAWQCVQR